MCTNDPHVRISRALLLLGISSLLVDPGPEFAHVSLVKTALTPLASVGASFQYPPINWSAVLSPLMRLGFGKSSHMCVSLFLRTSTAQTTELCFFLFFDRRGCTASVCGAGSVSSSVFSERLSLSGLLALPAPCAQPQRKFLLSRFSIEPQYCMCDGIKRLPILQNQINVSI